MDIAKYSKMYRQPSTTKNFPTRNVSSAEMKNSALKLELFQNRKDVISSFDAHMAKQNIGPH